MWLGCDRVEAWLAVCAGRKMAAIVAGVREGGRLRMDGVTDGQA